jgi:hypothetical protein
MTSPLNREELEEAICDVMNIYPSELEHNLPNSFGKRHMTDMTKLIDQYAQQVAIDELKKLRHDPELTIDWYLRNEGYDDANAQEVGEAHVAGLVEEYIDKRIAELEKERKQ